MRHRLRTFMQTIVLADGSSIRTPTFLSKNQPRVLLVKTDPRAQQIAAEQRSREGEQARRTQPAPQEKQE
ncbi:hypothetical protein NGA_0226100 [Nannochloropsis gaditana CCMP526]|uniref:uncharacterized protein n=1 Tax=Nannochloropsis gaditana (strain CCMP526) TaxID=1093141 RepID=UPI00029F6AA5|nr:hypothetical protein NGA_0226100 [Nannochloropsis gaditana CCMP526]EKU21790.1 hypothetical protein NGA_0226100 [Nannochloropsis gaditana CCMP526]|eukprot:XP_005854574.1 hypothetical protein NGA_0226100 [Nannochloropsis gaditana CCMP526]